ncbi:MAG: 4-alpha-glucanotransferase [Pseudomonadota bacterium]
MHDHSHGTDDPLIRLAAAHGVLPAWIDLSGNLTVTRRDTALALLRAMGAIGEAGEAEERLAALEAARAARALPPAHVVNAWQPSLLPAPVSAARWRLTFETGATAEGAADGAVALPAMPPGLHRLEIGATGCLVVSAPQQAPGPEARTRRERIWGATAALHGLWRVEQGSAAARGSYADLAAAAETLAALGASFVGVNPVHALGAASGGFSPYSPTHRGFFDTLAIPLETAEETAPDPGGLIDHAAHAGAQMAALRARFAAEMADPAGQEAAGLAAFRAERGRALEDFALFEALSLRHGANWRAWPAGFESPEAPGARAFAAAETEEIAFHAWAQWQADRALGAAQARARGAGMALGLYTDLAVGVRPDGAEVWASPDVFARGVSLGAPPDQFSPSGQSWGLAPFAPEGLEAAGYAPFISTIRAALRHAGLVRIDHVLGFERCFWVPEDGTPGGYVRSAPDVLVAIVRLEAARVGAVVVGEDLGVVPEGLRARLAASRIHGCAVTMYEHWDGRLRAPWHYRVETLASFGTHDTPTLAGWWQGHDIAWRERIGHTGPEEAEAMRRVRWEDRAALLALLEEARILPADVDPAHPPEALTQALGEAVHALMARSSSAIVAVQLDDAFGTLEQPNIPGTTDEHPNWRRRHAVAADRLDEHPSLKRIAREMRAFGRA